ncbi:MAG: peptidase [Planctomycetota bacterium]|nr:MAG: peptidase [Planctomycetota bacterium]
MFVRRVGRRRQSPAHRIVVFEGRCYMKRFVAMRSLSGPARSKSRRCAFVAAWLISLWSCGLALAASPSLRVIQPRGVQRGTDAELTFQGARLQDTEEVFFYEPGFQVKKLEVVNASTVKAVVAVASDCRLGEHVAQLRTRSGVSEFRTFYVGPFPAVAEKEPNTEFDQAQPIDLNVTVTGVVQAEDVDHFAVQAKKGQRISVEVEGLRLGLTMFDPYVAILDSKRFELAASDDSPLLRQDCACSIIAPEDGTYVIAIREAAYGGNGNCQYRMHVGTFPRPTAVYPPGGPRGGTLKVRFIGDPAGDFEETVQLPAVAEENFGLVPVRDGVTAPSANPFRLFEHGNALEQEPNDDFAHATVVQLPNAFNGIIEKPGDVDLFKFQAKKGQVFDIECYARRVRSPLDPVVNLYYANGRGITGNDDSRGPDSYFRVTIPADGEYVIRVADHLGRGGPDFVYRLEFHAPKPELTLGIPRVARYSQYRQWIVVPRGNRFATLITAARRNFGGAVQLTPENLPPGIKVVAPPMAPNLSVMPVVFEAAADAPIGGRLVDLTAKPVDPKIPVVGHYRNRADLIVGSPGQSLYWWRDVDRIPVVVAEEVPFRLEIVQPKSSIVQNGSKQLKIVAHRKEGFDAAIRVEFPFRPPGIGAASAITIPAKATEALYPLNASSGAQPGQWPIYVIGSADVGGAVWVASQMATLEVSPPYVQFAIQRTAVEQGQGTEIVCTIEQRQPFEGKARAELLGLPAKVTAPVLEFTKDTKELVFPVQTDKTSPPGRHRSVFCQATIMVNGEPVVHRLASTELRIDKPLPPKPNQPAPKPTTAPKPAPKPAAPRPVRLTRLQKLRLEAKKRAEAAKRAGGSR